jgi:signal transduction histidine kinase
LTSTTLIYDSSEAPYKKMLVWLGVLVFFSATYVLALLFGIGGTDFKFVRSELLNILPSLVGAWIVYSVSRHHNNPMKAMWFWLSISLLSLGIGDCVWAYLDIILKIDPFPSIADVFYIFQPISIIFAFSFVPREQVRTKREGLKFNLEIAIVLLAFIILAWHFYLADTVLEYGQQYLALVLSLIYPLMDVLQLITLSLLMFNGRGRFTKLQFFNLAIGLAGLSLSDMLFNIQEASNSYVPGSLFDTTGTLFVLLFAIAAVSSLKPSRNPASNSELTNTSRKQMRSTWRSLAIITQICLIIVFIVNAFRKNDQNINEIGVLIGSGIVLMLALLRQSVELSDNSELNKSLRKLSSDLEERVMERTKELNTKTALLQESQAQLVANEKLTNLGRVTASLAHEVNTPLAASLYDLTHAKTLVREYKNSVLSPNVTKDDHLEIASELEATHQRIESSLERLGRFIRRVREQSRMSSKDSTDFDAKQTLRDGFVHLEYQAFEHRVKLELSLPEEPVLIHGDPLRLGQVLNELVFSGIQACSKQSEATTSWIRIALSSSLKTVHLSVEYNGLTLDQDVLTNILEPKFPTLSDHSDGLGLSVLYDIVKGHFLGDIRVHSQIGLGTRFDISIPKANTIQERI